MNITVIGKGNVGGGLARLWERAGHDVTTLGRDGGDASKADVLVVAVPAGAIADALSRVNAVEGKPAIDATNAFTRRTEEFESLAAEVKSIVGGPVAKAFNANFAALYDEIGAQRAAPSCLYCSDPEAKEIAERLIRDAGYDPAFAGGLDQARALEDFLGLVMAVRQSGTGPFFCRIARPGEL
ncbi:MAG: dinucleotide-binding protein [Actinobacteria bacterium]|nr:dinucleotide-binding protein [Actinomycetota bacterium]